MKKINNPELLTFYINKYNITQYFSTDMSEYLHLYYWKKGEHICYEEDDVDYLYFFVKGKAKIYITLKNGKSLLLCFYENFKVIGDLEIMNNKPSTASVELIEDSYCIGIKKEIVQQKLLNDVLFLQFITTSLSIELERSSKNSSINLLYPVENRLASYILATSEKSSINHQEEWIFQENLTHLAELLGTSYRHLHRSLERLIQDGVIIRTQHYFFITDMLKLKKLAADLYK